MKRSRPVASGAIAPGAAVAFGIHASVQQIRVAVYVQGLTLWMKPALERIDGDEPRWIDFKEIQDLDRVRLKRRQERERRQQLEAERREGP